MPEDLSQQVLIAFSKIRKEIDSESSEFDIRTRIVQYFIRAVLGYSGKEYQVEKKRTDLTIFDENNFRVVVIETKRLDVDLENEQIKAQALSYADQTTKFVCLTNGVKFKLWEMFGKGRYNLRVNIDFDAILKHKRFDKITTNEISQLLFLDNLRKEVLWDPLKYKDFSSYYGKIEIKPDEEEGFSNLIASLDYIINQLLMSYTLNAFDEFKASYNRYLSEVSLLNEDAKILKNDEDFTRKIELEKRNLEFLYQRYLPFRGYYVWKKLSGRENYSEDGNKEIFCKETIYVMLNKLLFIRICEDKGLLPKNISNCGIENLKSHLFDPEESYKDILNIAYKTAGKLYGHFYELGILDWYIEGNSILNNVLNKLLWILNRFDFREIDKDVLGKLYEKYLPIEERKRLGEFYTPEEVIDYILDSVGYSSDKIIEGKNLLDPACGSGGFLVRAMGRLIERYSEKGLDPRQIIDNTISHIYGFDINPFACHITEMNLLFQIIDLYGKAREKDNNYPLKRFNIFHTDSLEVPELQKKVLDFITNKTLQYMTERTTIEKLKKQKFDFVVMNPPYVHQKGTKKKPKIDFAYRTYLRESYETIYDKSKPTRGGTKLNLFIPFIEMSIKSLKAESYLGFIVHKNLLKVESYNLLREFILNQCKILQIIDLGAGVFEDVTGETVIIILQKESKKNKRDTNKIEITTGLSDRKDLNIDKVHKHKLDQKFFYKTIDHMFSIYIDEKFQKLMEKMEKNSKVLGGKDGVAQIVSFGLNTIDNKKYVSNKKLSSNYKRAVMGRDVSKYNLKNRNKFVLYDEKILSRIGDKQAFLSKEKLIMQRIGSDLVTAYDDEQFYCFNSVNMILPKNTKYNLKYVLAILNSNLMNYYFNQRFAAFSKFTVNVTQGYLSQLPIHTPNKEQQKIVVKLVDELLKKHKTLLQHRKLSNDFQLLLKGVETTSLSEFPSVIFSICGNKIEKFRRSKQVVYLNLVDSIECPDSLTAKYVFYWLKSNEEKLKVIPDLKNRLTKINIPVKRKDLKKAVSNYEKVEKQLKELPNEITKLEEQINNQVYELYGVTKERDFIEARMN